MTSKANPDQPQKKTPTTTRLGKADSWWQPKGDGRESLNMDTDTGRHCQGARGP